MESCDFVQFLLFVCVLEYTLFLLYIKQEPMLEDLVYLTTVALVDVAGLVVVVATDYYDYFVTVDDSVAFVGYAFCVCSLGNVFLHNLIYIHPF